MRDDMFKVIVERPRRLSSNTYSRDGRHYRNDEESPSFLGMKKGYSDTKWLNENLNPLKRYLQRQVNRPWDKVYSEIRATIDPRSTVKQHILQHLEDFVCLHTRWEETPKGGRVMAPDDWRWPKEMVPIEDARCELYVHPRTGLLLRNRYYKSWIQKRRQEEKAARSQTLRIRRDIGDRLQLHRIEGVWYEVRLDRLPRGRIVEADGKRKTVLDRCWDVLRKKWVTQECNQRVPQAGSNEAFYGDGSLYAVSKRQLNSREVQRYGLNDDAPGKKARKGLFSWLRAPAWCKTTSATDS